MQAVDQKAAEARIAEDLLDHDDAADQIGEVERRDIERRHQRIGQRVAPDDAACRHAPQFRHADVVGVENLDQIVAQHAHGIDRHDDGKRQGREAWWRADIPGSPMSGRPSTWPAARG